MTSQLSSWIKRHSLGAYFFLAFLITWILISPLALSAQNVFNFQLSPHWHFLGALGPISAALLVTAISAGKAGVSKFLGSLLNWRAGVFWVLVSIFSPFAIFLLSVLILLLMGNPLPDFSKLVSGEYATFGWMGGSLLSAVMYGIGEEAGWRGFALPRLQKKHGALMATFLLSIFWALWHAPMFMYRFEFGTIQVIGFFIGMFAGAIWLTFLYNSTGGNTLMVIFWHTTWNIVNIIGLVVSMDVVSYMSAIIIVVAVLIVIIWKPARLSFTGKHILEVDS
ncbi:MAG: type II CAAX endopeptidase family protein [Anaerolineales bacterium]|jgi:membrane protease YdiL (CAAX protease family)|nr:type II CAAX endopeptidase family protein [Anaerolineales bacterium]